MICGKLTLRDVDRIYQRMHIKELVVFPWYDDGVLAGLITGSIEPKYAFLEHIVVLPEARNSLRVMLEMPKAISALLRARGVPQIRLCIDQDDPRHDRLARWARHCGYDWYANQNRQDWYKLELTKGTQHG